jgi:ubiquinone/menaquinone biosynthesis C-methylase UbiE
MGWVISLPDNAFDVAFLAAVIGEVPDMPACIRSLARIIRPGGLLVFVEGFPDRDRLSVAALRDLVEPADFVLQASEGSRWQDVVKFRLMPA